MNYTEDTLVQQTTAEYFDQNLYWKSVYAYNNEVFLSNSHPVPLPEGEGAMLPGGKICLGRDSDREVVLTRYLRLKMEELNPGLPEAAYTDAVRQIVSFPASQSLLASNREKYVLIKDGGAGDVSN